MSWKFVLKFSACGNALNNGIRSQNYHKHSFQTSNEDGSATIHKMLMKLYKKNANNNLGENETSDKYKDDF